MNVMRYAWTRLLRSIPSRDLKRNLLWNQFVDFSQRSYDWLHDVQRYLASHADTPVLDQLDVTMILTLDKALLMREQENEILRRLRDELIYPYEERS